MSMPKISMGVGIALIVLGIGSYILTGGGSITALIPAPFGLVIAGLGGLAQWKEDYRKHAMHGAAAVGLFGVLGTLRVFPMLFTWLGGGAVNVSAVISQLIMFVLCAVFVGLCVQSFLAARRSSVS